MKIFKPMTTYFDNGYMYFYDTNIKLWTIYRADKEGNQLDREADYYQNKAQLVEQYPQLQFIKTNK